jgi:hypothetical protein
MIDRLMRSGQSAQSTQGGRGPQGGLEQQTQSGGAAAEGSLRYDRRHSQGTPSDPQNSTP